MHLGTRKAWKRHLLGMMAAAVLFSTGCGCNRRGGGGWGGGGGGGGPISGVPPGNTPTVQPGPPVPPSNGGPAQQPANRPAPPAPQAARSGGGNMTLPAKDSV